MAIDPLSLILASAVIASGPASDPVPALAAPGLDYDRLAAPVATEAAPIALALAKTCSDPWWKMSGIQLVTCMIAHPDETFGPSDSQE